MSLFFETLLITDGEVRNLKYHNARLNRTIETNFGIKSAIDLASVVDVDKDNMRCKVIYGEDIVKTEYHPLKEREFKSFKIIESNIDYNYKYLDRSKIDELYKMRGEHDDIIIVRDGKVLDTTIANIAYWDGRRWITPREPLLTGTMRASLLDNRKIFEGDVTVDDILEADRIAVMNAIVGFYVLDDKFEMVVSES